MRYEQATERDYDELLNLANYTFSASHEPHDFKRLIPKEYDNRPECAAHHVVARDERGIRAMVAVRPGAQTVAGHTLLYGYVGTVCAHIYDRGQGHMTHLVPMAVDRARAQGFDYMALGGERARYARFGFEPGGTRLHFAFLAKNLPAPDGISVELVEGDAVPEDVFALYAAQPVTGARPRAEYMTIARTWMSELYAARLNGALVGAIIRRQDVLTELLISDAALAPRVLSAFAARLCLSTVRLDVMPWQRDLARVCADVCNHSGLSTAESYHILNYASFIRAMLDLKATFARLQPGTWVFRPEDAPRALRVTVDEQNHVTVCHTHEPCEPISHKRAHMLLLHPIEGVYPDGGAPLGWLPLPAGLQAADQF